MSNRIWPESDSASVRFLMQASTALDFCEVILRICREANMRAEQELPSLRRMEIWADAVLRTRGRG